MNGMIPGPSPSPRSGGGLVPNLVWGAVEQSDAARPSGQATACYQCVLAGDDAPPAVIVLVGGYSYCVSHVREAKP